MEIVIPSQLYNYRVSQMMPVVRFGLGALLQRTCQGRNTAFAQAQTPA